MRDAVGLTMLKLGKDPAPGDERPTRTQAVAEMQKAVDAGIVRAFMGNDYAEDMVSGNVAPGDGLVRRHRVIKQAEKETAPSGTCRTRAACSGPTTCSSPRVHQHKYTAELMIDFVYDPAIAAQIAAYGTT